MFSIGLPSAITSLLANVTSIIKNNLTASYGDIELAAYGIIMKADMLPLNIGMGTACTFIVIFEIFAPQIVWLFIREQAAA